MSEAEKKQVSLTTDDLQKLITAAVTAAVEAAKKPNELEQQKLDAQKKLIEDQQRVRLEGIEAKKQELQADAFRKKTCLHEGGKPKHSHSVYVSDELGGYVLCQVCRAVIRPEDQLKHFPKDVQKTRLDIIFDTALFNKVFQATDASGVFA